MLLVSNTGRHIFFINSAFTSAWPFLFLLCRLSLLQTPRRRIQTKTEKLYACTRKYTQYLIDLCIILDADDKEATYLSWHRDEKRAEQDGVNGGGGDEDEHIFVLPSCEGARAPWNVAVSKVPTRRTYFRCYKPFQLVNCFRRYTSLGTWRMKLQRILGNIEIFPIIYNALMHDFSYLRNLRVS